MTDKATVEVPTPAAGTVKELKFKAGDVVKVRVTEVDVPRKRIGLTMRKDGGAPAARDNAPRGDKNAQMQPKFSQAAPKQQAPSQGAFGAALAEAMKRK